LNAYGAAKCGSAYIRGRYDVDFRKIRTPEELVLAITRIDEALASFYCADSITGCATSYDHQGQTYKTERRLERAEVVKAVYSAVFDKLQELLADLRAIDTQGDGFLALKRQAALKIDPATAEMIWVYGDPFDPYGIGPEVPDEHLHELCYVSSPGSKISVWVGDLPNEARQALRLRLANERAEFIKMANHASESLGRPASAAEPTNVLVNGS
jgi:hypothetical protein